MEAAYRQLKNRCKCCRIHENVSDEIPRKIRIEWLVISRGFTTTAAVFSFSLENVLSRQSWRGEMVKALGKSWERMLGIFGDIFKVILRKAWGWKVKNHRFNHFWRSNPLIIIFNYNSLTSIFLISSLPSPKITQQMSSFPCRITLQHHFAASLHLKFSANRNFNWVDCVNIDISYRAEKAVQTA